MESKTSIKMMRTRDREARALDYRRRGYTHAMIGKELGVSTATSFNLCKGAFQRLLADIAEAADEVRQLEILRLDGYLQALDHKCEAGDEKAINTALRIQERRAKLLGLDKPVQVQVEAVRNIKDLQADLQQQLEQLATDA